MTDYSFHPEELDAGRRRPGISAFMRIRNGADFLERVIESHIGQFDEIVAVYNQCTDATPEILKRLVARHGDRLRVFHYLPPVYPPGSPGHAAEPPTSERSLVNYYNYALARTRFSVAIKLDDDQLSMPAALQRLTDRIRNDGIPDDEVWTLCGINLARDETGRYGIPVTRPLASLGDHAFFNVSPSTFFTHDRRFERFSNGGRRRVFQAFLYWHLKYLKSDFGFGNYGIDDAGNDRYRRRRETYMADRRVADIGDLRAPAMLSIRRFLPGRSGLTATAWRKLKAGEVNETEYRRAIAEVAVLVAARDAAAVGTPESGQNAIV